MLDQDRDTAISREISLSTVPEIEPKVGCSLLRLLSLSVSTRL